MRTKLADEKRVRRLEANWLTAESRTSSLGDLFLDSRSILLVLLTLWKSQGVITTFSRCLDPQLFGLSFWAPMVGCNMLDREAGTGIVGLEGVVVLPGLL